MVGVQVTVGVGVTVGANAVNVPATTVCNTAAVWVALGVLVDVDVGSTVAVADGVGRLLAVGAIVDRLAAIAPGVEVATKAESVVDGTLPLFNASIA